MYGKADSGVYFGIVYLGVSNILISYILYVVSLLIFQRLNWFGKVDYLVAQMIAFILSVLWSFYWNNKFVLKQCTSGIMGGRVTYL